MISIEGLKVEFGVKPLFSDVSYVVNDHDRIALVGKNGAGKIDHAQDNQWFAEAYCRCGGYPAGYDNRLSAAGDDSTG